MPSTYGTVGTEYGLVATWDEDGLPIELKSATQMPSMPQLDSIWFEIPETSTNDSLGLIWTEFTDPEDLAMPTVGPPSVKGRIRISIIRWEVSLTTLLWMGGHSHLSVFVHLNLVWMKWLVSKGSGKLGTRWSFDLRALISMHFRF